MLVPLIESLEPRSHFSATLVNGVLTIQGTAGNDRIDVDYTFDNPDPTSLQSSKTPNLTILDNGKFRFFAPNSVHKIIVRSGFGDDTVNVFLESPYVSARRPKVDINTGPGTDILAVDTSPAETGTINTGAGRDLVVAYSPTLHSKIPASDVLVQVNRHSGIISVRGSNTNDDIGLSQLFVTDSIGPDFQASINGLPYTISAPTASPHIRIDGGAGDDRIDLGSFVPAGATSVSGFPVSAPATLSGGAGNDTLFAGSGPNRIFGGPGDDQLYPSASTIQTRGGPGLNIIHAVTKRR